MDTRELGLKTLTKKELNQIGGGGWAYDLGNWIGDRMCNIKAGLNAYYNYWGCGCWDTGC